MLLITSYEQTSNNPPRGEALTFLDERTFNALDVECQKTMGQTMAGYGAIHRRSFFMTFFGVPYRTRDVAGHVDYKPDAGDQGLAADSRQLGVEMARAFSRSPDLDTDVTTIDYSMHVVPNDFDPASLSGDGQELVERMRRAGRQVVAFTLEPPSLA